MTHAKVKTGDWPICFSCLFFLSGLAIIIAGSSAANVIATHREFFDVTFDVIAVISILVGILILLVGYFGTMASVKESPAMLKTFSVMVIIIFFVELALGAGVFTYHAHRSKRGDAYEIDDAFKRMDNDSSAEEFVHWAEQKLKCCGTDGPSSYDSRSSGIPPSCCPMADHHTHDHNDGHVIQETSNCTEEIAFREGCSEKFEMVFEAVLMVIGVIVVILCAVDILLLFSIYYYLKHIANIELLKARVSVNSGLYRTLTNLVVAAPKTFDAEGNTVL